MPVIAITSSDAIMINAQAGLLNLSLLLVMSLISLSHPLFIKPIAGRKIRRALKLVTYVNRTETAK